MILFHSRHGAAALPKQPYGSGFFNRVFNVAVGARGILFGTEASCGRVTLCLKTPIGMLEPPMISSEFAPKREQEVLERERMIVLAAILVETWAALGPR